MPRHLSLLVSAALLYAAIAVVIWVRGRGEQHDSNVSVARTVDDLELKDVYIDPQTAIGTIQDVRSRFGSVLGNTELDLVDGAASEIDGASGPQSFEDFLKVAAGMTDPAPDNLNEASSNLAATTPGPADGLSQSLQRSAALLVTRAQQAKEDGDVAEQQRFAALATLLRAEADALAPPRQAKRSSDNAESRH
jgi:hypothetical protein